jgi:hypothetical protein
MTPLGGAIVSTFEGFLVNNWCKFVFFMEHVSRFPFKCRCEVDSGHLRAVKCYENRCNNDVFAT